MSASQTKLKPSGESARIGEQSSQLAAAPVLSRRGLTLLLGLMCLVPIVTISIMQLTMPPVRPGELKAEVSLMNVPPANYYDQHSDLRLPFPTASVVVKNSGDQPWTHVNVRLNRDYQIYQHGDPIKPGESRAYFLDRFVSRTGAQLNVRLTKLKDIEIYARLPDKSRATFEQEFPK